MSRTTLNLNQKSYTNKDFNQVYPELLELAKSLSNKWDPTISNESDPGVVLIKEMALGVDKINYNTDKAALEQSPSTTQQPEIAQELFRLLGYYPDMYISAKEYISIRYAGTENATDAVIIPRFTMVKNEDEDLRYTIVGFIDNDEEYTSNIVLPLKNDQVVSAVAYEGYVNTFEVNGATSITENMLDSKRRIYFNNQMVAQNGVFVYQENSSQDWKQVDNIALETEGTKCYSFGLDSESNDLYLEFPEWISSIMQDGIIIKYIVSTGSEGTAPLTYINQFSDVLKFSTTSGNEIEATTDNFSISNYTVVNRGSDPETIDEMYRGYKKTCGTFDTLVTTKDYENAIYNTEKVSNGRVCDRSNDVQTTYLIQEENKVSTSYTLAPYKLKLYLLQYQNPITSKVEYQTTFTMPADNNIQDEPFLYVLNDIEEKKLLCIDYQVPVANKICLLTNVYDLEGQVYTNARLTDNQITELNTIIQKALYAEYNSRMIDFGEPVNRNEVLQTIKNADKRIISAYLDEIEYRTYAQYYDTNGVLRCICISDECPEYIQVISTTANSVTLPNSTVVSYTEFKLYQQFVDVSGNPTKGNIYSRTATGIELYSDKRESFRNEIIAKTILAGKTNYYVSAEENFNYYMGQRAESIIKNASSVATDTSITIPLTQKTTQTIPSNTVLQFIRPTLYDVKTYSMYVKYELKLLNRDTLSANEDYQLSEGEYFTAVYKVSDDEQFYRASTFGSGCIIKSNVDLISDTLIYSVIDNDHVTSYQDLTSGNIIEYQIMQSDLSSMRNIGTTGQVVVRDYDELPLTSGQLFYVISSTEEDGDYVLTIPNTGVYTLKNNEYVIVTDTSKSYMITKGPGTKISTSGALQIRNKVVSSSSIALLGINAIPANAWNSPTNSITLIAQEYINLPENTTVETVLQFPLSSGQIKITSLQDPQVTASNGYQMTDYSPSLIKQGAGYVSGTISSFITGSTLYHDTNTGRHTNSVKITSKQVALVSGDPTLYDVWEFTNADGAIVDMLDKTESGLSGYELFRTYFSFNNPVSGNENVFTVGLSVTLSYFIANASGGDLSILKAINYTLPNGETGTIIPGDQQWNIHAYLNLNTSKGQLQTFSGDEKLIINGNTASPYQNVNLESDVDFSYDGNDNSPISDVIFRIYTGNSNVTTDMKNLFHILPDSQKQADPDTYRTNVTTNPTYLATGTYILKVSHNSDAFVDMYMQIFDWTTTTTIATIKIENTTDTDISAAGSYLLHIDGTGISGLNKNVGFKLRYKKVSGKTEDEVFIDFKPLQKLDKNSIVTSAVNTLIQTLDANSKFNYLHQVDTNKEITNPVSSKAFMNKNHPYNKFTICEINDYKMQVLA